MPPKKKGKRGLPPGALYHEERKYFKLLFCGKEFPAGAEETRKALEKEEAVGNCEFRFVRCAREDVAREIVDADIAVPLMTKIDDTLLSKANNLKLVLQFGVGLEGVDEEACTKRGILLARIPSEKTGNADSTAEMAVYLLLAALRRVNQLARSLQDRKLGEPCTVQLKGKIVTIVGWGHIGKEVARRLRSFKCKLQAARKSEWPKEEQDFLLYDEEVRPLDDIKWIKNSDAVVICANQTKENMGMINDEFMSHMKPGAVLGQHRPRRTVQQDTRVERVERRAPRVPRVRCRVARTGGPGGSPGVARTRVLYPSRRRRHGCELRVHGRHSGQDGVVVAGGPVAR
jgi:hypothetical protein